MTPIAQIDIKLLEHPSEAEFCAQMMAGSEPWVTLGRTHEAALRIFTDPSRDVYLAMAGDEIVGFVILVMTGAFVGYIQSLCVAPACRGQRIGERLVIFAEDLIFQTSPNVFICVSSFNPGAQRFYQRLGYHEVGELKDYVVSGHSEILLRKAIAPLSEFQAQSCD